jgi:hypothetical protein
MNDAVAQSSFKCKKFTGEIFIGLALLIVACEFSQKDVELFISKDQACNADDRDDFWRSISPSSQFEQFMPFGSFKDFRQFLPKIHIHENVKDTDPCCQFLGAVDEFIII